MATILLVDDHPVIRRGLLFLLEQEPDMTIVGEAEDGEEAVAKVEELSPEVVLMDIEMPKVDGLEATRRIRERHPEIRVIALTMHDEPEYVREFLRAGAIGYVLKRTRPSTLVESVKLAITGQAVLDPKVVGELAGVREEEHGFRVNGDGAKGLTLSPAELQLLQWLADDLNSKAIGVKLKVSQRTAKGYVARLLEKLGVHTRAGAVGVAVKMGILVAREAGPPATRGDQGVSKRSSG